MQRRNPQHSDWIISFSVNRNVAMPLQVQFLLGAQRGGHYELVYSRDLIESQQLLSGLTGNS
jgi:hypothetical protein